jgi:hypothetical protein
MIPSAFVFHLITALRRLFSNTWPSAVVAVAAWISIVVAIDPAGSYPNMPEGPGLTVDEIFNVEQGVLLVEQARSLGWLNLIPGTSVEAFKPENQYLPDHPPLGRYWLGVHHHLTWWLAPPFEPEGPFVTACARTGSATAFALTVWLIGAFVGLRWADFAEIGTRTSAKSAHSCSQSKPGDSRPPPREDRRWVDGRKWEGFFASLALVLMPRVYGHAHLASLETITNLTCTAAVLAVAAWWNGAAPPSRRVALLTGIVMGLALLTKIQAVLIPIPVLFWALWRWRMKAIVPLLVWGVTANVVFFALWPYLWLDPIGHFLEYLGRTTNRATIHCFYFGVRYDDKAVPWHYPFVMFAVTVPVGMHLLGAWGASSVFGRQPSLLFRSGGRESPGSSLLEAGPANVINSPSKEPLTLTLSPQSRGEGTRQNDILLLACTVFPLIVFALPGVAVYDGERLFLTVFPLWAIFIGKGICKLAKSIPQDFSARAIAATVLLFLGSFHVLWLWSLHPGYLCYYNALTGGTIRAGQLGLELDYWGVGVTRELLTELAHEQLGRRTPVHVTPTLHQYQADEYRRQSPILRRYGVRVLALESMEKSTRKLIVFHRRADLPEWGDKVAPHFRVIFSIPSRFVDTKSIWFAYGARRLELKEDPLRFR